MFVEGSQNKKVVVFGGAGFLGSFVSDELTQRGYQVKIFDVFRSHHLLPGQSMIVGSILNTQEVNDTVAGADHVYNFAGLSDLNESFQKPVQTIELNVLGNTNVLEACRIHKVKRYVYASTVYALSNKGSFYGVSKRCSERIIEEYGLEFSLPFTVLRYGTVYGKRADNKNRIYRILKEALETKKITFLGHGSEERDYIHVQDAARLSVDILDEKFSSKHIVLTGVERFKYSQLLNMIREIMNQQIEIEYLNKDYRGHYEITPYSFNPPSSIKLISNPYVDLGQGLLETMGDVYERNLSGVHNSLKSWASGLVQNKEEKI